MDAHNQIPPDPANSRHKVHYYIRRRSLLVLNTPAKSSRTCIRKIFVLACDKPWDRRHYLGRPPRNRPSSSSVSPESRQRTNDPVMCAGASRPCKSPRQVRDRSPPSPSGPRSSHGLSAAGNNHQGHRWQQPPRSVVALAAGIHRTPPQAAPPQALPHRNSTEGLGGRPRPAACLHRRTRQPPHGRGTPHRPPPTTIS
jgi:hypothetical protein